MLVLIAGASACERTTYQEPHTVGGQTFYVERQMPSIGESLANAAAGCAGGVHADDKALRHVPTKPGCDRSTYVVDYVVDGLHVIDACGEVWRVRCRRESTASSGGPVGCADECTVEDHYTPMK